MSWIVNWMAGYVVPAVVAVLTPAVMAGIKRLIGEFEDRVPKAMIPTVAPIVGMLIELALNLLTGLQGIPGLPPAISGAVLGAVGVWVREFLDQWKKAFQQPPPSAI
jgi:hypothetical protein